MSGGHARFHRHPSGRSSAGCALPLDERARLGAVCGADVRDGWSGARRRARKVLKKRHTGNAARFERREREREKEKRGASFAATRHIRH